MTPEYNRWREERATELLASEMPRLDVLATIRQEEMSRPWERDTRPPPKPMPMGDAHYGLNPPHLQPA